MPAQIGLAVRKPRCRPCRSSLALPRPPPRPPPPRPPPCPGAAAPPARLRHLAHRQQDRLVAPRGPERQRSPARQQVAARMTARITIEFQRILIAEAPFYLSHSIRMLCPRKVCRRTAHCQARKLPRSEPQDSRLRTLVFPCSGRILLPRNDQSTRRAFLMARGKQDRLKTASFLALGLVFVLTAAVYAADPPFAGKWRGETRAVAAPAGGPGITGGPGGPAAGAAGGPAGPEHRSTWRSSGWWRTWRRWRARRIRRRSHQKVVLT